MTAMQMLLSDVVTQSPAHAWKKIQEFLWDVFAAPLPVKAEKEIVRRDRALTDLDNLLAGAAWNLWNDLPTVIKQGSDGVAEFWSIGSHAIGPHGKAVLILDSLSLRELPFLLQEAERRKYRIHQAGSWIAEFPGETTAYARALGFAQRSSVEEGKPDSNRLPDAWKANSDLPFRDAANCVPAERSVFFWHHWPDFQVHQWSQPGLGLESLAKDAEEKLTSDDFWLFVERLTTGRRLLITSDHGYAATGHFPDLHDNAQIEKMQAIFKGQRHSKQTSSELLPWIPPLEMSITSQYGTCRYALGRRKWKLQGGYPILQHGGLSLLEMFVPFIEIQR